MNKTNSLGKFDRIDRRATSMCRKVKELYEELNAESLYDDFENTVVVFAEKIVLEIKNPLILLEKNKQAEIHLYVKSKLLQQYGVTSFGMVSIHMAMMHLEAARSFRMRAATQSEHWEVEDLHAAAWDLVCEAAMSIGYLNSIDPNNKIDINRVIGEFTKVSQSINGERAHPSNALKAEAIKQLRSRQDWFNKKEAAEIIVEELGKQHPEVIKKVGDPIRIVMGWIDDEGEGIKSYFTHWGKKRGRKSVIK